MVNSKSEFDDDSEKIIKPSVIKNNKKRQNE